MYTLPLVSTLLSSLLCSNSIFIGIRGAILISNFLLCISFCSSIFIWYEVCICGVETYINLFGNWFNSGSMLTHWHIYIDIYTAQMLLTVTSVSTAVHLYTVVYMRSDPHLNLFISYLSLFTFFMLVLVCSDNLIGMLVGWEGIGICSYLLIGYWNQRLAASKSAAKAIIVNRVSDGLLLWGVLWIWWSTGTLEYDLIVLSENTYISLFLSISLLIGAMGKSAQILFHVWLADAMEGPTPVSALIHAATLVTAGVYLMVRLSLFYSSVIIIVGSLTAFMGAVFGLYQNDIKRVIAFSTCSQLGYMMVSVGLGEYGCEASMSHLMTHASFKAALFLAAGVIITSAGGTQQLGRYGGLTTSLSSMYGMSTLMIASLCLMAFPETSGYYSKETIINLSYITFNPVADYAHTILLLAALMTCIYSVKVLIQSYYYDFSGTISISNTRNILIVCAFTILIFDIILKIWVGTNLLNGILFFVPWIVKTLPVGLMIGGILTATAFSEVTVNSIIFSLMRFNATRYGIDQLYARTIVCSIIDMGRVTLSSGDKGLFLIKPLKI